MGVGVQGEGRIGVTQDAGQGLGIHTAGQCVGGEGVPQVMEANQRQSGIAQQSFHPVVGRLRRQRQLRHGGIVEDPIAEGFFLPVFQQFHSAGRQLDAAVAGGGALSLALLILNISKSKKKKKWRFFLRGTFEKVPLKLPSKLFNLLQVVVSVQIFSFWGIRSLFEKKLRKNFYTV